ncbi:forkhead box protein L1-like [Montipora capricornis]|uniref:forkhead box protein L1-like n=1 Tax=Montipora capricornis TaxID=246305 RepID=UPI0035F16582
MERHDHLNPEKMFGRTHNVPKEEKRDCVNRSQKKKPRRKRNSSPLSYIEIISYAILGSPRKRATLAEIYSFIQDNYPEFTENRLRWKNTVRHNLSLHECFQRGEVAMDKAGCYWHIHPSFLAEFSCGDFSRRKLARGPPIALEVTRSTPESQFVMPSVISTCHICKSAQPYLSSYGSSLHYHRQGLPELYGQLPYFPRDRWIY